MLLVVVLVVVVREAWLRWIWGVMVREVVEVVSEGEEAVDVVVRMQGASFSLVASKQRAEALVVEVGWLVEGEEEVVVGSVVKKGEEGERGRDVDGLVSVDVVVMRTVVTELDVGGDGEGYMNEYLPEPRATSVTVSVCVAVISLLLKVVVVVVVERGVSEWVIGVSANEKLLVGIDEVEEAKQPSP